MELMQCLPPIVWRSSEVPDRSLMFVVQESSKLQVEKAFFSSEKGNFCEILPSS